MVKKKTVKELEADVKDLKMALNGMLNASSNREAIIAVEFSKMILKKGEEHDSQISMAIEDDEDEDVYGKGLVEDAIRDNDNEGVV